MTVSNHEYITKLDSPNMTKTSDSKRVFGQERKAESHTTYSFGAIIKEFLTS